MKPYLMICREAFRRLHGLTPDRETVSIPENEHQRWFRWVRRHRVQGLLHAGLKEAESGLRSGAWGQARHTSHLTQEAERLAGLLAPRLRRFSIQKGPALARQAWPDLGLRSFDDLDLICHRSDYRDILVLMEEAGYHPEIDNPRRRAHRWHYGWSIAFRNENDDMIEVNHRYFPPQYPWPRDLDACGIPTLTMQHLELTEVKAPTPAMHLLLCSMHAIWHGWARLEWLADIGGLLVRHPEAGPEALRLSHGCPFARRALRTGCGLAAVLFGDELQVPELDPAPAEYIRQAEALLTGLARPMSGGELRHFHEQFMTPKEKRAYRIRRILVPGDGDFVWIPLPVSLRSVYWLLRPVRALLYGKTGY